MACRRMSLISNIYNQGPAPEITGQAAQDRNFAISAAAWHKTGMIVINPDWITGWADRELLMAIATKMHGNRSGTNGKT